jgi:hypothetical protein
VPCAELELGPHAARKLGKGHEQRYCWEIGVAGAIAPQLGSAGGPRAQDRRTACCYFAGKCPGCRTLNARVKCGDCLVCSVGFIRRRCSFRAAFRK